MANCKLYGVDHIRFALPLDEFLKKCENGEVCINSSIMVQNVNSVLLEEDKIIFRDEDGKNILRIMINDKTELTSYIEIDHVNLDVFWR